MHSLVPRHPDYYYTSRLLLTHTELVNLKADLIDLSIFLCFPFFCGSESPHPHTYPEWYIIIIFFFIKYFLLIILLQLSHFSSLPPSAWYPHSLQESLTEFMSMGHTYKFFGFSIFHTILNLPLSILYQQLMLLIPCTIFPILPLPPPCWEPSMWSPFLWFCYCSSCLLSLLLFSLVSVVDICEFVVILLLVFLITFFFLDKSL